MSSSIKNSKLVTLMATLVATLALSLCLAPSAFAASADGHFQDTLSSTSVQVYNGTSTVTVNFSSTATGITTAASNNGVGIVPIYTTPLGGVYNKSGWQVLSSNSYVKVADVLTAAGASANYYKFYVSQVNYHDDGTQDLSYGYYTKYNGGNYSNTELTSTTAYPYFGTLEYNTAVSSVPSMTPTDSFGAVIGLQVAKTKLTSLYDDLDDLVGSSSLSYTDDVMRLIWGYDTSLTSSQPGNRFPSLIVGISVV